MNYYEIVFIIHPGLPVGHIDDTVKQINEKISREKKGKVLFQDNWGKKKLAYLIQKQKYGTYIILQCEINDGNFINELNDEFEHNVNIIRHLITKINAEELLENNSTQINKESTTKEKAVAPESTQDKQSKEEPLVDGDNENKVPETTKEETEEAPPITEQNTETIESDATAEEK